MSDSLSYLGGGPCDADGNNVVRKFKEIQRNEHMILDDKSSYFPIINNMESCNQTAVDASNFSKDFQLNSKTFKGINSLYCFMVEENEIIGYSDSWILGLPNYISNPAKNLSQKQSLLFAQKLAGDLVNACSKCGKLFKIQHKCRIKEEIEESSIEEKEEGEGKVELMNTVDGFCSIVRDGNEYYLGGEKIIIGTKLDALFDRIPYCGVITGFTEKGRARLHFPIDNDNRCVKANLRLCKCPLIKCDT